MRGVPKISYSQNFEVNVVVFFKSLFVSFVFLIFLARPPSSSHSGYREVGK